MGQIPVSLTSFVGRALELDRLIALLSDDAIRLVTLTGPGGIGKTRLALEAVRACETRFGDGAVFVDLSSVRDPRLVPAAIAPALLIQDHAGEPLDDQIAVSLQDRELLLLLDNFEQVVDAAALLPSLLVRCPHLTLLVTSREVLRVSGEYEVAVPPLGTGTLPAADTAADDAVQLFLMRARACGADLLATTAETEQIAQIAQRLDGLPLAIELAASRLRVMSLDALHHRLEKRLPLLTSGPRDSPRRQQTLRDTIRWSFDLLTPGEQELFCALAVCAGSFSLEAASAIAGDGVSDSFALLDPITSLVEKSLLRQEPGLGGEPRFRYLETIREFALEQLDVKGVRDAASERHARYFASMASQSAGAVLRAGIVRSEWIRDVKLDHANLQTAIEWAFEREQPELALEIAVPLWIYFRFSWYLREPIVWYRRGLSSLDLSNDLRARTLTALAVMLEVSGELRGALDAARRAHELFVALGDDFEIAFSAGLVGEIALLASRLDDATIMCEMALDLFRRRGLSVWTAFPLKNLGQIARLRGQSDLAAIRFEASLQAAKEFGFVWGQAEAIAGLGELALSIGNVRDAARMLGDALDLYVKAGEPYVIAITLADIAAVAATAGQAFDAAVLIAAEDRLRRELGYRLTPVWGSVSVDAAGIARNALTKGEFDRAWAIGSSLSLADAAEFATQTVAAILDYSAPSTSDPQRRFLISDRELEVLRHLRAGRTDQEIADALFISKRTVTTHVSHILAKLGAGNRTEAATIASREGLI